MLKYAFAHILETLFLSFLTSILTPNVDKNRALEFTSINLRHSYILHLFFNPLGPPPDPRLNGTVEVLNYRNLESYSSNIQLVLQHRAIES